MDILILGAGAYLLYAWYLLMYQGKVKEGVLVPTGSGKKCRDIAGYQKFIGTKLLVFALTAIVCGVIGLVNDYVAQLNSLLYLGMTAIFFVVLIWFTTQAKKGEKEFF